MVACGVDGVQIRSAGLIGLGCGRILGERENFSQFIRYEVGDWS